MFFCSVRLSSVFVISDLLVPLNVWQTPVMPSQECTEGICPSLNFSVSKKCLPKYKIWGWKFHTLGELRGKIEILCTDNLLGRNFAAICRKIATSCAQLLCLTHDAGADV